MSRGGGGYGEPHVDLAMQPHDAQRLLATLGSVYGLAIRVVGEIGDGGEQVRRVNATNPSGRTISIVHTDLGGAALELAERLGFDATDS